MVTLLVNRLTLNSRISRKPPSTDGNQKGDKKPKGGNNKPGGQNGHVGTTLRPVDDPDEIKLIELDRTTLPLGQKLRQALKADKFSILTSRAW